MHGLTEAAARIGAIAGAIEQIASRTNLLALNATIEAARAGEAGRGFAVVAAEVKQLAGQTARATSEIAKQISEIRAATSGAVAAMNSVTAAIQEVDTLTAAIAAAAEQQGAATREIAGNIGLVSNATAKTANSMRTVSGTAQLAKELGVTVSDAAVDVTRQSDELRTEIEEFLAAMRATTGERRRYERNVVQGATASLHVTGRDITCTLHDISLGGCRVKVELREAPGAELSVRLPGASQNISARIVGIEDGGTRLFFSQSEAAREVVTHVLQRLVPGRSEAA